MTYERQQHWQFLGEELKAQTETFNQKLNTSALFLLHEREELFVAQFLKFRDGEMILKFSNRRGVPRQREYLNCFTVPKDLRNYRNWGRKTYGDLIRSQTNCTEIICIWHAPSTENDFSICAFRGMEIEFANNIQNADGIILILGPNKPPIEYLKNLQNIVNNESDEAVKNILDQDFHYSNWKPVLLDNKKNTKDYLLAQLLLQNTLIVQGPPGTGKTHLIAEICAKLCTEGMSVLVTALTNRALIEIAEKPALNSMLLENLVLKTKLSLDELIAIENLQPAKEISPQPGKLILSTFYIVSGQASQYVNNPPFDYVIVDEASQALLAMFAAARMLGKKNIWIGDTKQLPPVVAVNEDQLVKKNYGYLVNGLAALIDLSKLPIFQLTETFRLTDRAAYYTGLFYSNNLTSKSLTLLKQPLEVGVNGAGRYFHQAGGPTLIKTDLEIDDLKPTNAVLITLDLINYLISIDHKLNIAVLTHFVQTTKILHKHIYQSFGNRKNILVDTVARVQGLTTDICIFIVPNASYYRSIEKRLFNVATSRSRKNTIIIADKEVLDGYHMDSEVKNYLEKLDKDFSFYVKMKNTNIN
ncbi:DNA replication ATP-dependent helicase Dna2 [Pedobacter sp. CG_S7]|uniref:AAA domain-containing protein n=1 Tax=Pedobacter sp. CG_S7 TaxID=3143930 RepID=UPI0033962FEB